MPLFGRRHARSTGLTSGSSRRSHKFRFFGKDRDRVAGGYKAALSNPNTTRTGRKHAKRELNLMGRGNEVHVPFMTKIRRALGIRSSPRRTHHARTTRRTRF